LSYDPGQHPDIQEQDPWISGAEENIGVSDQKYNLVIIRRGRVDHALDDIVQTAADDLKWYAIEDVDM
jgi:hypothetical protein